MKKELLLSLSILSFISSNLNADEVVGLEKDINITEVSSKSEAIENHAVKFALEFGAKTNFWNPGLSKEQGGDEILKYDTEGLYLGSAILKTKIYGTDVLSLEKFRTLKSSDNQNKLLAEYKDDREKDSSFDGFRASIQIMKIFNYLFDTDILQGLKYEYTTRNFMGSATLEEDSIFWFGNNPGSINTDYSEYSQGKILSFQTKFVNQELYYTFGNFFDKVDKPDTSSMLLILGAYNDKWEKPTYIGNYFDGKPVLFHGKYESTGILFGFKSGSETFDLEMKYYIGIDNNFQLANNYSAKEDFDRTLGMKKFNISFLKTFPKIYSTNYFDMNFLIKGDALYSSVTNGSVVHQTGTPEPEEKDAEELYGISLALEFTF